ncbi:MAG: GntR family transcriptional regulator [Spirochaetaceae bacterium]|nr:MAG: GntR family transcriptional regulator [Spirochaetaceae bacterium]
MATQRDGQQLQIRLDPGSSIPFYRQIILQVEMAIADGRVTTGYKLPTVRGLAVDLQINPNTVAKAYSELEIRGLVSTQHGTGTFIGEWSPEPSDVDRELLLSQLVHEFMSHVGSYGFTLDDVRAYLDEKPAKDGAK